MPIYEKFGDVTVAISDISSNSVVRNDQGNHPYETHESSKDDELDLYAANTTSSIPGIKKLISSVVQSVSDELDLIRSLKSPDEIELELGFSLKAGGWIVGLESQNEVKLTITWRK